MANENTQKEEEEEMSDDNYHTYLRQINPGKSL